MQLRQRARNRGVLEFDENSAERLRKKVSQDLKNAAQLFCLSDGALSRPLCDHLGDRGLQTVEVERLGQKIRGA